MALSKQTQGILWKITAGAAFAVSNSLVRHLTGGAGTMDQPLSADVIAFFQYFIACAIMAPVAFGKGFRGFYTQHWMLHGLRIVAALGGVLFFYYGLTYMPMGKVVALQFIGPVFSILGARLYLKEDVGMNRWIAIALAMGGGFIITRPDQALIAQGDPMGFAIFLPIASAACLSVAKIAGRELGVRGETPEFLALILMVFMVPASFIPASFHWVTPTTHDFFYLMLLGLVGWIAHYTTSKAYCMADVTLLLPFGFTRILFSIILGMVIFQETHQEPTYWIGVATIAIGSFMISLLDMRQPKAYGAA